MINRRVLEGDWGLRLNVVFGLPSLLLDGVGNLREALQEIERSRNVCYFIRPVDMDRRCPRIEDADRRKLRRRG